MGMTPEQANALVREQEPFIFGRMFGAVEKVRERMERACQALENAGILYAVIGGNAVAAWVATKDDGAVRNTRDVNLLLRGEDLDRATEAMQSVGFYRDKVMDVTVFLDGPDGKPSQGVHILRAEQKVKETYASPAPANRPIDHDRRQTNRGVGRTGPHEVEQLSRQRPHAFA